MTCKIIFLHYKLSNNLHPALATLITEINNHRNRFRIYLLAFNTREMSRAKWSDWNLDNYFSILVIAIDIRGRACIRVYVSLERFQPLSSRRVSRYGRKRGYDRDNANTDPARSDSWSLGDLTIDLCLGIVYRE